MTHPLFRDRFFLAASILMLSGALAACGGDDETTSTASSSSGAGGAGGEGGAGGGGGSGGQGGVAVTPGDIEVTVNYTGVVMVTDQDSLNVVAFKTGEPMGSMPPGFFTQPNPMFPAKVTLKGLPPAMYDIYAVLDIGSDDPGMPNFAEDLFGISSMPVDVKGGDVQMVTVTIADK